MPGDVPDREALNDTSRRNILATIGGVITGGGILFGLTNSDAFNIASTFRESQTNISQDSDAIIPITGKLADTTPTFGNRFESDLTITLSAPNEPTGEFDVGDTGTMKSVVTFTVAPGKTTAVKMSADTTEMTVAIDGNHDNGVVSLTRVFEIPQSEQIDVTASVNSSGKSGKFSFGLQNTGSINATLSGIRIDGTTTTAATVSKGSIFSITSSEDTTVSPRQLISTEMDIDDSTASSLPVTTFDGNDTVFLRSTGDETVFEFDRFQNPPSVKGSKNTNMKNETITVTVKFGDGSMKTFDLSS